MHCYRDDYNAPLVFDRQAGGWRLVQDGRVAEEVPGGWFSPRELHALIAANELLRQLEPGLIRDEIAPIAVRIEQLLEKRGISPKQVSRRVRLVRIGVRETPGPAFACVAQAVIARNRLRLRYRNRGRLAPPADADRADSVREVSPQRLTWYRGNWYLDAWCHLAGGLRRFALERIVAPEIMQDVAEEIDEALLDQVFGSGFGVFSGLAEQCAVLRFTPYRARWVAEECWHTSQQGRWLGDGSYELTLPFTHAPELVMDILKYGPDCEVLAPRELRLTVKERLREALALYGE
ncbi:Proteasome accessory factor C [Thiorhodovibrio winogradskyi]|uniref:Proteasome accessory factor C n=1 Tax=Thiorhodovibrio winogradskyi TaxID=77007 RepID=A0ABZ0SA83_9GAMM|nr:WYL domain-containing protein [Thiorhodovibrio winogradskyi]